MEKIDYKTAKKLVLEGAKFYRERTSPFTVGRFYVELLNVTPPVRYPVRQSSARKLYNEMGGLYAQKTKIEL